ncbi:hypothetical protein VB713_21235 [Anabaena cylindrica UHCC 0172]|uniref:hypothetical protein n=1 Tax=Anabaena cylindrica TaxID=1165 RepID=UPI002B1F61D7|nr:hypothetical protein [Anabaena cylindrica]MEA5553466.1 hypothetical protein [Anabaena cylindrica UHCC 0172]
MSLRAIAIAYLIGRTTLIEIELPPMQIILNVPDYLGDISSSFVKPIIERHSLWKGDSA